MDSFVIRKSHIFWLTISAFIFFVLYSVRNVIAPFLLSFVFVIFLSGIVDKLEKFGIKRGVSSFMCTFLVFFSIIYLFYISIPVFYSKINSLLESFDKNKIKELLTLEIFFSSLKIDNETKEVIMKLLQNYSLDILNGIKNIFHDAIKSSVNAITMLCLFFLSPMITFFTLKDLPRILSNFYGLIPNKFRAETQMLLTQMRKNVFSYIEGQILVGIFLTIFYGLLLSAIKVQQAFLIGSIVGFASFIPYLGFYASAIFTVFVVYGQFHTLYHLLLAVAVLCVGQIIEGNFVTPKIIGNKVGLHPNWVIFGMLSCLPIFGVIGVVFALPLTGVCGVLVRHVIKKYKQSSYY
jgi:predicted PurR-regulated permease PerM